MLRLLNCITNTNRTRMLPYRILQNSILIYADTRHGAQALWWARDANSLCRVRCQYKRMRLNSGFCSEEDEVLLLINIFMNINGQPDVDLLPIVPYTRIWSGWATLHATSSTLSSRQYMHVYVAQRELCLFSPSKVCINYGLFKCVCVCLCVFVVFVIFVMCAPDKLSRGT